MDTFKLGMTLEGIVFQVHQGRLIGVTQAAQLANESTKVWARGLSSTYSSPLSYFIALSLPNTLSGGAHPTCLPGELLTVQVLVWEVGCDCLWRWWWWWCDCEQTIHVKIPHMFLVPEKGGPFGKLFKMTPVLSLEWFYRKPSHGWLICSWTGHGSKQNFTDTSQCLALWLELRTVWWKDPPSDLKRIQ